MYVCKNHLMIKEKKNKMSHNKSNSTNPDNIRGKLNADESKKWELNIIGNFVLNLYHRSIITPNDDWCVKKSKMREEYIQLVTAEIKQKLQKLSGTSDIGTLLRRSGFLWNTEKGSSFYKIRYKALFDFRNDKIKQFDNLKILGGVTTNDEQSDSSILALMTCNPSVISIEDNIEVDENEPKIPLEYQGTIIQRRVEDFFPTNMSCCICQEDFSSMESFEEHIQIHGDETDFEFLDSMAKEQLPISRLTYRLCKNSHNFCFELETNLENLIIERIIIVQSRSFFYVHNVRLPYKCEVNSTIRFFVDAHLFTRYVEKPIILICHLEDSKNSRIVEQHHFMRSEEFPKVNFPINPYRLPNKRLFKPKIKLQQYYPSSKIQDALKDDIYYGKLMAMSNEFRNYICNEKILEPDTIVGSLKILLQIEDIDTIQQYIRLTQKNIKIRSCGDEYSFQLKSTKYVFLDSLLTSYDEVILTTHTNIFNNTENIMDLILGNISFGAPTNRNTFVGLIQDINRERITFKCHKKIDIHGSYTVVFRPSRMNLRYHYRSLDLLSENMVHLLKFLFPDNIMRMPLPTISLNLYNKDLNAEQIQAARNIADGPRNDATYIIYGPPGTGKTSTLVESILQILKRPNTKVLVTASSNCACDEVALRLCKYLKQLDMRRGMVRIYARSCEISSETIDDELLDNSNMYNGQFYPDVEILHEYRVVVCTLSVVAKLSTGGFGRNIDGKGLYTHLLIDEVAASMETDALVAITSILTPKSCLIIAGDNKQLGPVLKSKRAKSLGLDISLMDRLLKFNCYCLDGSGDYDRTIQTRLIRNYRSHPEIVNLYNGLYYNHTLEALANIEDVSLCKIWHRSRNKEYPIIFHASYEPSICGRQSHSLYNIKELFIVMDYVKDLMYYGINGEPVKESDIGIISPYKTQYKRIQEELNSLKWFDIETGSVETFQGKEKNIIIVSFVRSGTGDLGFLEDQRRLNVILSRPKSFLIMIGNPNTLSLNRDFDYIIKECQRHKTFIGPTGPSKRDVIKQSMGSVDDLPQKLKQLNKKMQNSLSFENIDQQKVAETKMRNRQRHESRRNRKINSRSNSRQKSNNEKVVVKDMDREKDRKKEDNVNHKNHKKDYFIPESSKNKIESIFFELPQVPNTSLQNTLTYTKEQLLELSQQQENNRTELGQQLYRRQLTNQPQPLNGTPTFSMQNIPSDIIRLNTAETRKEPKISANIHAISPNRYNINDKCSLKSTNQHDSHASVTAAQRTSLHTTRTVNSIPKQMSSTANRTSFNRETKQQTKIYPASFAYTSGSSVSTNINNAYSRTYSTYANPSSNFSGYPHISSGYAQSNGRNESIGNERKKESSKCVIL